MLLLSFEGMSIFNDWSWLHGTLMWGLWSILLLGCFFKFVSMMILGMSVLAYFFRNRRYDVIVLWKYVDIEWLILIAWYVDIELIRYIVTEFVF